jgi:four helix bundle protein
MTTTATYCCSLACPSSAALAMGHRELRVWQDSVAFVHRCYALTKAFPRHELYGLVAQIRRAAGSVPANIAEGYGRVGRRDYIRYVGFARASLFELDTHMEIAFREGYLTSTEANEVRRTIDRLSRMLTRLRLRLAESLGRGLDPRPSTPDPTPPSCETSSPTSPRESPRTPSRRAPLATDQSTSLPSAGYRASRSGNT